MSKQTLRALAKDYAKGVITKDIYRKSRSELIKGIVSGQINVKEIAFEAPLKPSNDIEDAITEGIDRDKTEITSPQQKSKPNNSAPPPPVTQSSSTKTSGNKSPFMFILISAIIVISLILAVILFYPKPPEATVVDTSNNSSVASEPSATVAVEVNQSAIAETLMGDFLSAKNWNDESMDNFIASWEALTQEQKDAASDTKRMQRMKASIYKQFLEGKALASIDSEKAILKQQKLIDFANAVGISDSRLTLD